MKTLLSTILILTIMGGSLSFAKGGHSSKGKSNSIHGVKLSHHKQKLSQKDVI